MKKLISILLLSLYLLSTTELYQLLKVPILIEHFMEHKKLNPDMTLEAFLKTHYDNPVKDADYKTDQKLPFIVHSAPLVLFFTLSPSFTFDIKNTHVNQVQYLKIPSYDDIFYIKGFSNSIWEPPRNS